MKNRSGGKINDVRVKKQILLMITFLVTACVSKYSFDIEDTNRFLSVEGVVSDVSYNDFGALPAYPRYFDVRLRWTGKVTNAHDEFVSGAVVSLVNFSNEEWDYVETTEGTYILPYEEFKVEEGEEYKLKIVLSNGDKYESSFESCPTNESVRGELVYEQGEKTVYEVFKGEEVIRTLKGVQIGIKMPQPPNMDGFNYRWDFTTTFVVVALLKVDTSDPNYDCWVTSDLFYDEFVLVKDPIYSIDNELVFFDTDQHEVYEGFSILIRQQLLDNEYYEYWYGIEKQKDQSSLFASPPFNLRTNIVGVGHDKVAYGYFGVVREQYYRWTFSQDMIDYDIVFYDQCRIPFTIGQAPFCHNCLNYSLRSNMTITNERPSWWEGKSVRE